MQITGDILYYWLKKAYGNVEYCREEGKKPVQVHNLSFWDSTVDSGGHLVVVTPDIILQHVHLQETDIYLCIDPERQVVDTQKEMLLIREDIPENQVYNLLMEIFEKFDNWEDQLESAVSEYVSFQSLIRSCDDLIQDPLALNDVQFRYIGYSKKLAAKNGFEAEFVDEQSCLPLEMINYVTADPEFASLVENKEVFHHYGMEDFLHKNIFYKDNYVGRLSIPGKQEAYINRYYGQILTILSIYIERLYEKTGTFWSRRRQNSELKNLLTRQVSGTPVREDILRQQLEQLGFKKGDLYELIQLRAHFSEYHEKLSNTLSEQLEGKWPGSICFIQDGSFYVLVNMNMYQARSTEPFFQTLAVMLRESLFIAGVSRAFLEMTELAAAARQTKEAIEIGTQKDPMFWYFKFDDYAFDCLLLKGMEGFLPRHICAKAVIILRAYDEKNKTELNHTLRTYLKNHFNAVLTAKELYIARSTFLKRMERIEALTGIHLDDPQYVTYLMVSYTLFDRIKG